VCWRPVLLEDESGGKQAIAVFKLEKDAQLPSAKYRPTRLFVDAALRTCDVLERADTAITKLQISPLIVNGFKDGFHQRIQRIFLVVVEAKKFFPNFFFFKIWMHFTAL